MATINSSHETPQQIRADRDRLLALCAELLAVLTTCEAELSNVDADMAVRLEAAAQARAALAAWEEAGG